MKKVMGRPNNVRTDEEIKRMISLVETAIEKTPAKDNWGNSNARDICEMKSHVRNLKSFLKKGLVEVWTEVYLWLENDPRNFMKDFEV